MAKKKRFGLPADLGRQSFAADPNTTFVSIYCADLSHKGVKVPMRTFIPHGVIEINGEPTVDWIEWGGLYQSIEDDTLIPVKRRATQWLDAANNRITAEDAGQYPERVSRARVKLMCDRHSAPVFIRNLAELNPVFTALHQANLPEVPFSLFIPFARRVLNGGLAL
jgi:hypothetical protein